MKNNCTQYSIKVLKEYAEEKGIIVRSTSDLSPLEEYLLFKLYKKELELEKLKK